MEIPLETTGVDNAKVLNVMVSGNRLIMKKILLTRYGLTEWKLLVGLSDGPIGYSVMKILVWVKKWSGRTIFSYLNLVWVDTLAAKIGPAQPKMVRSKKSIKFMPFAACAWCETMQMTIPTSFFL